MNKKYLSIVSIAVAFLCSLFLFTACNDNSSEKKSTAAIAPAKKDSPVEEKKETPVKKRPPIINITDTVSTKMTVLCVRDSAASFNRIALKLGNIYGVKLAGILKKTGMKPAGQPMAWYNTQKAPYYFEAGIPVEKKAGKLPSNAFIKQIGLDSVTVAHFYGPYDLLPEAYDALKEMMKDRKKKAKQKIYEIYVGDPMDKDGKLKDPYKVQTDVVFTWQ